MSVLVALFPHPLHSLAALLSVHSCYQCLLLSSSLALSGSTTLRSLLLPVFGALLIPCTLWEHCSLFTPLTSVCCSTHPLHIPCTLWQHFFVHSSSLAISEISAPLCVSVGSSPSPLSPLQFSWFPLSFCKPCNSVSIPLSLGFHSQR